MPCSRECVGVWCVFAECVAGGVCGWVCGVSLPSVCGRVCVWVCVLQGVCVGGRVVCLCRVCGAGGVCVCVCGVCVCVCTGGRWVQTGPMAVNGAGGRRRRLAVGRKGSGERVGETQTGRGGTAADGCGRLRAAGCEENCKKSVLRLRRDGFEPPTPCLKGACSTIELPPLTSWLSSPRIAL